MMELRTASHDLAMWPYCLQVMQALSQDDKVLHVLYERQSIDPSIVHNTAFSNKATYHDKDRNSFSSPLCPFQS